MLQNSADNDRSTYGDDASVCGAALESEVRSVLDAEQDAHAGVKKVEAAQRVYGRRSRWCLFIGCVVSPLHRMQSATYRLLLIALDLRRIYTLLMRRQHMHTSYLPL